MAAYRAVLPASELPPGEARRIEIDGLEIALFNIDGTTHATENTCLHAGGPLHEGTLEEGVVTCPWHDWKFEVATGRCNLNPKVRLRRYPVRVREATIEVSAEAFEE
ncbi:MAG: Rieske (2Fe-2S) protein [Planctomycetota bacterium]